MRPGETGPKHKHGHAVTGARTPTYRVWQSMHERCYNASSSKYPLYGARGITVCQRWSMFENFLADMGEKPEGKTLDRIENDGSYSPTNCRWASYTMQARNRRNTKWKTDLVGDPE